MGDVHKFISSHLSTKEKAEEKGDVGAESA